jgi:transcription factor SFP1
LLFSWHRNNPPASSSLYLDSQLLESGFDDEDSSFPLFFNSPPKGAKMTGSSSPIAIVQSRTTSTSPRPNTSNLTSALQNDSGIHSRSSAMNVGVASGKFGGLSRQEAAVGGTTGLTPQYAGAQPISMGAGKSFGRRESNAAGSLLGGGPMSWGGISVGSLLKDRDRERDE